MKRAGRKIEIDMHAKGIDQHMIDLALATGMPVKVSPEVLGRAHGHAVSPGRYPRTGASASPAARDSGLMALSAGSRSFTRYGYADLMREDRRYDVLWRIWPGTQRLLLWGDPVFAAGYSRAFQFCGSCGVEVMEPLSFKGRRGSGIAGSADRHSCKPPRWDWEKYPDTYRVWGQKLYNPDGRTVQSGSGAARAASRILPIVTTAHMPSAANNTYWPEIYTNQPMVDPASNPYTDTPAPKVFGNVTPLDPQLFSRMNDFAGRAAERRARRQVLAGRSGAVAGGSRRRRRQGGSRLDVQIQAGLGRFFAAKFRAGVLYHLHEQTGDRAALEEALKRYRARARRLGAARESREGRLRRRHHGRRAALAARPLARPAARDRRRHRRGGKANARREGERSSTIAQPPSPRRWRRPKRVTMPVRHTPPAHFEPRQPLALKAARPMPGAGRLYYRHVNQAERWQSAELRDGASGNPGSVHGFAVPAAVLLRVPHRAGQGVPVPGLRARSRESTLLRSFPEALMK